MGDMPAGGAPLDDATMGHRFSRSTPCLMMDLQGVFP